ncbi:hypothetical protein ScPMuIL_008767 [Solemya velum]
MATGFSNDSEAISVCHGTNKSQPKQKRKKKKTAEPSCTININNCTGIQIGDHNQSTLIKQLFENSTDGDSIGLTKNELLVSIVKHVLTKGNTSCQSSIPMKELERGCDALIESLWARGAKRFQDVSKWSLTLFLVRNKDVFSTHVKGCKTLVRLKKPPPTPTEINLKTSEICDTSSDNTSGKEDDNGWTVVSKKGKRETKRDQDDVESSITLQSAEQLLIKSLLCKHIDCDLAIYESDNCYKESPEQFMLDIVSMWNTPNRIRSHILLGVKSADKAGVGHTLVGLKKHSNDQYYQSLFIDCLFSSRPKFKYFEVEIDQKTIGVVEISTSFGCGQPSITQQSRVGFFEQDELWFRPKTTNTVSSLSNLTTVQIFHWFSGKEGEHEKRAPPDNSSVSIQTLDMLKDEEIADSEKANRLTSFNEFYKTVYSFKKGDYILVSGNISCSTNYLSSLSGIPWLYIFDLDVYSRSKGLANAIEDSLGQHRHLIYRTIDKAPIRISETETTWCFLRGMSESVDSLKYNYSNANQWYKAVRKKLGDHCEVLANFADGYTVLTVIVFWPEDESLIPFLNKVIGELDFSIEPSPKIVMCMSKDPQGEEAKALFQVLCGSLKENLVIVRIQMEDMCFGIFNILKGKDLPKKVQHELPRAHNIEKHEAISEKDAAWLREELEVLYMENPYTKTRVDVDALEKEAGNFFRGGTLHWFAWYECGAGHFDVERGITDAIKSKIEEKKEDCKSCIITLFHAPGSGGTTLAQRILWDFHKVMPCAQRFPYKIHETQRLNNFWLRGIVTPSEAKLLTLKLSERCDTDEKKKLLKKLCKNVEKGCGHHLYEFGLTTFSHEFHGVRNYVRGYLQLDSTPFTRLLHQHSILAYLSLVYYYAQTSLPRQFFAGLLNKPPNYEVDLDDFPDSAVEFIVSDTKDASEGREKNIRICHYMVAKEILEQLLCRDSSYKTGDIERLSEGARRNLKKLCLEFIEYASRKKTKQSAGNHSIILILAKTFIFRDNKNIGDNENQARRKPKLSSVMCDIHSPSPLFTERLQVLEALVEAFPWDPNFHAHLGRFYSHCRQDEDSKAEQCFLKALELCDMQSQRGMDERLKQTYMHIYHMFGTVFQRKMFKYTGRSHTDKSVRVTQKDKFPERLEELVGFAELAQAYFRKSRDSTPRGQENVCVFGGEISVLLQVCDFVERNRGITDFLTGEESSSLLFIRKSISDIQNLIIECYDLIDTDEAKRLVEQNVLWFNLLFREKTKIVEQIAVDDDLNSRRLLIAAKKLKWGTRDDAFPNLDCIASETDIKDIIRLHEENFTHISVEGLKDGKNDLEIEYKDWMHAIRHRLFDKCYSLEYVLSHVRQWDDSLNSPLAKYYLFILTSLIGFGTSEESGKTQSLVEAQTVLQELIKVSKCVLKPRYPREWLGKNENGIKRLRSGIRFSWHSFHDDREGKYMNQSELAACKGTIFRNNSKLSGSIELDLGENNNCVSVKVFYIPEVAGLAGVRFVGMRVEFFMSFTLDHGYEAYSVKKLRKHGCSVCSTMVEIFSAEEYGVCHNCNAPVQKMEMTAVD